MTQSIIMSPEYRAIRDHYGSRTAKRSGVPLMNHIDEGLLILDRIEADPLAKLGFCLHPLIQEDEPLSEGAGCAYIERHGITKSVFVAMEYRGIANAYLAHHAMPANGIRLSPLKIVNDMLIADKVQNRKDFRLYHFGRHPNSVRLDIYFSEWMDALGITPARYSTLISGML